MSTHLHGRCDEYWSGALACVIGRYLNNTMDWNDMRGCYADYLRWLKNEGKVLDIPPLPPKRKKSWF